MWQKLRLNFLKILFYLFLFSIPFGTRVLLYQFTTGFHEYEAVFLYASDIFLILLLLIFSLRITDSLQIYRFSYPYIYTKSVFCSLLVFLSISAISIFLAFSKGLAIYSFARLILLVLSAFAVSKILKEEIVKLENVLAIIAGSAVLQAFIGIFQFFKQSSLGLGFLGESVIGQEIGGVAKIAVDGAKIVRAYGTFPHPNILAAFLLIGLCSLYYLWLKSSNNESVTNKRIFANSYFIRYLVISISIFITLLGLMLSFSRTAWFIALLVSAVVVIYSILSHGKVQDLYLAILIFATTLILFAAFNPYILSRAKVSGQEPSVSYRVAYNKMALEIIKEKPSGIGIGNQVLYSVKNGIYQKFGMDQSWQWQPIHNIYLLIASEVGILGLISFLIFLTSLFLNKKSKAQMTKQIQNLKILISKVMPASLLLFGLVDHFLWTLQPGRLMLWLVIGILLASSPRSTMDSTQASEA